MRLISLVLGILLVLAVSPKRKGRGIYNKLKKKCYNLHCSNMNKRLAINCINRCVSANCFDKIYGNAPLEYGEIDVDRDHNFRLCVSKQYK